MPVVLRGARRSPGGTLTAQIQMPLGGDGNDVAAAMPRLLPALTELMGVAGLGGFGHAHPPAGGGGRNVRCACLLARAGRAGVASRLDWHGLVGRSRCYVPWHVSRRAGAA